MKFRDVKLFAQSERDNRRGFRNMKNQSGNYFFVIIKGASVFRTQSSNTSNDYKLKIKRWLKN